MYRSLNSRSCALGAFFLLNVCPMLAQTETTPSDGLCEKWTLNGYTLRMTRDAAASVRPMTPVNKQSRLFAKAGFTGEVFAVRLPHKGEGTLLFDSEGRLVAWSAMLGRVSIEQVNAELRDRLGLAEGVTGAKSTWIGRECDVMISLDSLPNGRPFVGLQRYSDYKAMAVDALE